MNESANLITSFCIIICSSKWGPKNASFLFHVLFYVIHTILLQLGTGLRLKLANLMPPTLPYLHCGELPVCLFNVTSHSWDFNNMVSLLKLSSSNENLLLLEQAIKSNEVRAYCLMSHITWIHLHLPVKGVLLFILYFTMPLATVHF